MPRLPLRLCHSKVFIFHASHSTIIMNHEEFQENYIGSIKMKLSRCCFFVCNIVHQLFLWYQISDDFFCLLSYPHISVTKCQAFTNHLKDKGTAYPQKYKRITSCMDLSEDFSSIKGIIQTPMTWYRNWTNINNKYF